MGTVDAKWPLHLLGRVRWAPVRRPLSAMRREPWLLLVVAVPSVAMTVYCVVRWVNYGAGFDLGIFDQAIWHYSRFEAPWSTIKGFDILGDHFDPTVALLAPLYWVWSDPRMLLIGASVLVGCSSIPVFMFARRRLPRVPSYLIAIAYAVFWGLQIGAGYEFHENDLGPLLIALAILFADDRRWGWFYVTIALILGVKEDLSIFVAFFGIYLLTVREWRRGAVLLVIGIVWYELATRVAIPHFAPDHHYFYWSYSELGRNLPDAVWALIKAPWRIVTIALSPGVKAHTLLYLFAPFLFLSLGSRWFILALPLLSERFLSTRSALWDTSLAYSLTIAPVLAMSAAAGLANLRRWLVPRVAHGRLSAALPALLSGAMVITSIALSFSIPASPFRRLLQTGFYRAPWFKSPADAAITHVPPGAPVAANDSVLMHLTHREIAGEIVPQTYLRGYLIADLGEPVGEPVGNPSFAAFGQNLNKALQQTTPIYYDRLWLVAKAPPPGQKPTNGVLTPLPPALARRLSTLTIEWQHSRNNSLAGVLKCAVVLAHHGTCRVTVDPALAPTQRRLSTALTRGHSIAVGPCKALAQEARSGIRQLGSELLSLQGLSTQPAMVRAGRKLSVNINYRDLPGRLDRFLALCSPRTG